MTEYQLEPVSDIIFNMCKFAVSLLRTVDISLVTTVSQMFSEDFSNDE